MTDSTGSDNKKSVLVLGHDARMVLPILRSLGRRGIKTDVGWCPPDSPAVHSKFVRNVVQIPIPGLEGDLWIDTLKKLIRDNFYQLVIPACEPQVYLLQSHRDAFQEFGSIYLINEISFKTAINKVKTYDLARSLEIPVPRSSHCESREQLNRLLQTISYPVILKPACSVDENNTAEKNFVMTASSEIEAQRLLGRIPSEKIQIQEQVTGVGVGIEFLAGEGKLLVVHQHRRLHETTGHGSTYRVSVPVDPELSQATARIIKQLNYTGVGMCEFRVDEKRKKWWFIEINARFWGSLPLAVAAGVDFPLYFFQLLVEGRREFDSSYRIGTRCRNLRSDLRWNRRWLRQQLNAEAIQTAQKTGWKVNPVSYSRNAMDWLRMFLFCDHQDMFARDDPGPAAWEARQVARSIFRRVLPA